MSVLFLVVEHLDSQHQTHYSNNRLFRITAIILVAIISYNQ